MKRTLDDLNAIPGVTATGTVTMDVTPPADPAAMMSELRAAAGPGDGGWISGGCATPQQASPELAVMLARESAIKTACETYSRRQVSAFADYRVAADRAWQDYQRAMAAADRAYETAMAAAGADYDESVTRNA